MPRSIIDLNYRRGVALRSTNLSQRDILNAYGAYQWWLSKNWLNEEGGNHPGQILWRTGGWAADSELYIIGAAIRELHRNGTKRAAFEAKKREFLSEQRGNQTGYLFELLVAQLLSAGGNSVTLRHASAEGYDLDVLTPDGVPIQVSCKVAEPSEHHKRFFDANYRVSGRFKEVCQAQRVQGGACILQYASYPPEDKRPTRKVLEQCVAASRLNQPVGYTSDLYVATVGRLPHPAFAQSFSSDYLSYTFIAMQPVDQKAELTRVVDRVKKANRLFRPYTTEGKLNLTVIRVPTYLSIESARERLEQKFGGGDFSNTSAVLLLQSMITKGDGGQGPVASYHAYQYVINPGALSSWPTSTSLNLVQPLGYTGTRSPQAQIAGQTIQDNFYVYMDIVESIIVPAGTPMFGSDVPGVRRLIQSGDLGFAMEMPSIPMEFSLL